MRLANGDGGSSGGASGWVSQTSQGGPKLTSGASCAPVGMLGLEAGMPPDVVGAGGPKAETPPGVIGAGGPKTQRPGVIIGAGGVVAKPSENGVAGGPKAQAGVSGAHTLGWPGIAGQLTAGLSGVPSSRLTT
jgi:hypothetical protein